MNAKLTRRELAATLLAAPLRAAESKPNVLLILSDDHSRPFMGAYGNPVVRTPNLDRFASEGMRFERAFTAAPQCVPSRAALMTGRSPAAARIARFNSPLPPDVVTMPELLRSRGYFTGICRRNYHLDGPLGGRMNPEMQAAYEKYGLATFDKRVDFLDRGSNRNQTQAKVNEFFDKRPSAKPFFLWVSFNDPHHVWDADAIPNPYDPKKIPLPPSLPDLPGVREDLARYCGEVTRMDEEFQWVIDIVKSRGEADNTIVIFMGDNGFAFPHGKGSLYDLGLNVPMLVRWPGRVKPGAVTSELISGEDLAPTMLEAAGIAAPNQMSGRSFLKLLRGEAHQERKYIFAQRGQHGGSTFDENTKSSGFDLSRCVRSARYKLIYNCTPYQQYQPVDSANDSGWKQIVEAHKAGKLPARFERVWFTHPRPIFELYDVEKDPAEMDNLAGKTDYASIEHELKVALQEKMILDYDFLPLPLRP